MHSVFKAQKTGGVLSDRSSHSFASIVPLWQRTNMQAAPTKAVVQNGHIPDLSRIKGVLFDIDGTLTCSDPLHLKAFQDILVEVGFNNGQPIDEAFFRQHISGRHNPEIAADLFPDWSEDMRVAFYEEKEQRFRDMAGSKLHRMPGLTEFISWLEGRGLRKAAVTNAPKDNTLLMLAALELDTYFEAVVLGEECERAKPHPDPYLKALKLLGLQPHEAIVIEDSPSGVRAACAAGIPCFGITSGQDPAVLLAAGCCMLIKDYHQLLALAEQHCAAAISSHTGTEQQQQEHAACKAGTHVQPSAHMVSLTADGREC